MNLMAHTSRYVASVRFVAVNACLCALLMGCEQRSERETVAVEPQLVIDRFILGNIQTNCYCLRASRTAKDCLIIDTGADHVEPLIDFLQENWLHPVAVIFTHGHSDHVNGVALLRRHFPEIKAVVHKDDAGAVASLVNNVDILDRDGPIEFAGIAFQVFHTPGHTPGGMCLYSRSQTVVFSGDTLFAGSIGRTDFGGGSTEELVDGIRKKLLVLPEETVVYPGHGPSTTIGKEKAANPFLK